MRKPQASSRSPARVRAAAIRPVAAAGSPSAADSFTTGVATIPAHAAFLDSVAAGFIDAASQNPQGLADRFLLVPDSETAIALKRAFVAALGDDITMLPHIEAVDSLDPATVALQVAGDAKLSKKLLALKPAVTAQERQMVLAREIMKMPGLAPAMPTAMKLAAELGRFIDMTQRMMRILANSTIWRRPNTACNGIKRATFCVSSATSGPPTCKPMTAWIKAAAAASCWMLGAALAGTTTGAARHRDWLSRR